MYYTLETTVDTNQVDDYMGVVKWKKKRTGKPRNIFFLFQVYDVNVYIIIYGHGLVFF